MKKLTKSLMMILFGAMVVAPLASCDDDDNNGETKDLSDEMKAVTSQYVNNVVYPTYSNLANKTADLYDACVTMKSRYEAGSLTQSDVDNACEAFKSAREYWEKSEAFLFGAASDFEIDPHIDSWPLDQGQMASFLSNATMVNGLYSDDPIAFVNDNYGEFDTALGFHGLEFVLFRDGANRPYTAFSGNETHESFSGKTVACKDELAFLVAVSGDVRDHCYQLEVSWLGDQAETTHIARVVALGMDTKTASGTGYYFGENMLNAGDGTSTMHTVNEPLVTVVGSSGCGNICNEVAEQKLGQAYRVATGTSTDGEESIDYIESPYSHRSFIDYRDNLYSIKNSLYGNFDQSTPNTNSVINFLKNNGYEDEATLETALNEAIESLTTPINAGHYFVENPQADYVENAINKIAELNTQLEAAARWIEQQ